MKRWGSVLFIVLLLMPVMAGNAPQSATAPLLEQQAILSVDGSESPESITSFSTTLASDTLFYPDLFHNDTIDSADTGSASGDDTTGSYTDTFSINGVSYGAQSNPSDAYVYLNFTVPSRYIEGVRLAIYGNATFGVYTKDVEIYDFTAETWTDYDNLEDSNAWYNHTTYDPDYWSVDDVVYARIHLLTTGVAKWGYIDYAEVTWYVLHLVDSDHFGESFVGISDWTTDDTSISSDGDVATITENGAGSTGRAYASFSSTDHFEHYYEFRIESMTATTANLEFWDGAAYNTLKTFTAAGTYKGIISDTDAATMQRIGFLVGSEGGNIKPDYLRLFPANESGWSFDGSTTAGTDDDGSAAWTYAASSNGDILTITQTRTGSGNSWSNFKILYDTTTTSADIEQDYYQFFGIRWRCTTLTTESVYLVIYADGEKYDGVFQTTSTFGWTTSYYNLKGATGSADSSKYIRVVSKGDAVDEQSVVEVNWTKMFSIANFTATQSGTGSDDYLYVDSGVLYSSIDDGYIELNHDPALTVNTATYNVWNTTTGGTAPEFDNYVGSWAGYSSETRGSLSSGTLTDLRLKFDSIESISAIKFIEDGTAPAVVRSSSTPNDPEDDESVTLSAVITDTVEVYSVAFNAIVYPTGFSDVDYDATEQADNLWNYTFSSLDAGYYCFKIIASDGANTNALTEYAYIELTVREAAIMVEEITLIGAGEDFTMMTFSARINRDCSYTIYEESASSAESDTHTGSVSSPSFNLAWTKLDVEDANVNFTIKFTSGSLTYNYTSQYQVAQNTFYVSTVMQVDGLDTVTVLGRISKLGNYLLYDENNVLKDSGSITDLDFTIRFTKWSGYDEQDHDFAIKFTNGTQTCWYNSSYYAFKKPVAAAVVTTDKNALYAFQASFWTGVMVAFIGLMVAIDLYRRYLKN